MIPKKSSARYVKGNRYIINPRVAVARIASHCLFSFLMSTQRYDSVYCGGGVYTVTCTSVRQGVLWAHLLTSGTVYDHMLCGFDLSALAFTSSRFVLYNEERRHFAIKMEQYLIVLCSVGR